jgi:peptide/nickel transport system permease protein
MLQFALRRLAMVPFILFGVSVVVFLLMKLIPGDAAVVLLGPYASDEALANLRRSLGLDQPFYIQYLIWLGHSLTGDFGRSIALNTPVADVLADRVGNSMVLTVAAFIIAGGLGISLGIWAAVKRFALFDRVSVTSSLVLANTPPFWLGLVLVYYFSLKTGLLPSSGMYTLGRGKDILDLVRHLLLPAATAALIPLAVILRLTRSAMVDVLNQQYITAARARGLSEAAVIMRHGFRNIMAPVINISGLQLGYIFGTALFSEVIFNWPGVGLLMFNAIVSRDVPSIQAVVLVIGALFVLINFLSDLTQAAIDPRARR